jgi:hypothetical protein
VFSPPDIGGRPNPDHLERAEYVAIGRRIALVTAQRNGAGDVDVTFPGNALAPLRVQVTVRDRIVVGPGAAVASRVTAEAELVPPGGAGAFGAPGPGEYSGPLAYRQGKPMRPDVALAFDRMAAAAAADGVSLIVNSGFRTNAEQAALFAAHPDPKWVAPPGRSLHRLGTELDLGPAAAYGWLAKNAGRFHFVQRYSWEPWHYGFSLDSTTAKVARTREGKRSGGTARTARTARPARARATDAPATMRSCPHESAPRPDARTKRVPALARRAAVTFTLANSSANAAPNGAPRRKRGRGRVAVPDREARIPPGGSLRKKPVFPPV